MMWSCVPGFEVSSVFIGSRSLQVKWSTDANILYYLESWTPSPSEPSMTTYLNHIESFQRMITTAAFTIAGGVDLSNALPPNSKPVKQYPVAPTFVTKITKAFLDALYAYLDGLVHLASDESPVVTGKRLAVQASKNRTGTSFDAKDGVSCLFYVLNKRLTEAWTSGHPLAPRYLKFWSPKECTHTEYDDSAGGCTQCQHER